MAADYAPPPDIEMNERVTGGKNRPAKNHDQVCCCIVVCAAVAVVVVVVTDVVTLVVMVVVMLVSVVVKHSLLSSWVKRVQPPTRYIPRIPSLKQCVNDEGGRREGTAGRGG